MKKLNYIDALRGLAILGVILVHTIEYGHSILPHIINNIIGAGAKGVQLFYIASAFTLFLSYKQRYLQEKYLIRNFFIRRFFRIAPMYYLGIFYYLIQDGLGARYWLGDATHITIWNILANLFFLHGFNPYWITSLVPGGWSIGVEMTFYMGVPFLFSKVKNINQAFSFFLFSVFIKLLLHFVLLYFPLIGFDRLWKEYLFLYFPSQLPVFSLGIIVYFYIVERESLRTISGRSVLLFAILILAQLSTGIKNILSNHILFGFGFLLLAYALSRYNFRMIVNPIMIYIGKISFSMYLVHFAVLHWLNEFKLLNYGLNGLLDYTIKLAAVLSVTIILSDILHTYIEMPFQNLGKRWIARWENSRD